MTRIGTDKYQSCFGRKEAKKYRPKSEPPFWCLLRLFAAIWLVSRHAVQRRPYKVFNLNPTYPGFIRGICG